MPTVAPQPKQPALTNPKIAALLENQVMFSWTGADGTTKQKPLDALLLSKRSLAELAAEKDAKLTLIDVPDENNPTNKTTHDVPASSKHDLFSGVYTIRAKAITDARKSLVDALSRTAQTRAAVEGVEPMPSPGGAPAPTEAVPMGAEELAAQATQLNNRAVALHMDGKYSEAIAFFTKSIRASNTSSISYSNLAHSLVLNTPPEKLMGADFRGTALISKALELSPDNAHAMNLYGVLLTKGGNHARALGTYTSAMEAITSGRWNATDMDAAIIQMNLNNSLVRNGRASDVTEVTLPSTSGSELSKVGDINIARTIKEEDVGIPAPEPAASPAAPRTARSGTTRVPLHLARPSGAPAPAAPAPAAPVVAPAAPVVAPVAPAAPVVAPVAPAAVAVVPPGPVVSTTATNVLTVNPRDKSTWMRPSIMTPKTLDMLKKYAGTLTDNEIRLLRLVTEGNWSGVSGPANLTILQNAYMMFCPAAPADGETMAHVKDKWVENMQRRAELMRPPGTALTGGAVVPSRPVEPWQTDLENRWADISNAAQTVADKVFINPGEERTYFSFGRFREVYGESMRGAIFKGAIPGAVTGALVGLAAGSPIGWAIFGGVAAATARTAMRKNAEEER